MRRSDGRKTAATRESECCVESERACIGVFCRGSRSRNVSLSSHCRQRMAPHLRTVSPLALVPWTRTHKPFQRMGFIAQVQRPSGLLPVQAARDRIPPWRLSILSAEHPPAVSAWSRSGWRHPHGTRWPEHGLQVSKKTRLAKHTVPLIVVKCFAYALGWIIERSSKPAPPSLAMVSRTATTQYPPHVFQGRKTKNCQLHLSVHTPTR